jgi:tetratricopeptide (TPR) repeat protein
MNNRGQRLSRQISPDLIYILLLLVLGLTAYANSFFAPFHFDDIQRILQNDAIRDLTDMARIFSYTRERFLTYLSLAINYRISRFDPASYHIVNFFIHYIASIFLYFLFIETWKTPALKDADIKISKKLLGFFAAGIFLVHPLQTQSVTYIIQRAASLAGMFYLATVYWYVKARLAPQRDVSLGYYVLFALSALAAVFSKETAVTLPVMIALYEIFFFKNSIKSLITNKMFLLLMVSAGIIVGLKLKGLVQRDFVNDPGIPFTRWQYLLTQFSVLVTYLRLFFWPAGQNIDWDYPIASNFFEIKTISSFLFLLVLIGLAVIAYRKFRLFSFGIFAFFLTLMPSSSIVPILDVIYEHRMYLAVAFLAMGCLQPIIYGVERLRKITPRVVHIAILAIIMAVLPLLTGLTYARNEVWTSNLSLWEDSVKKSPNKARPHNNYGRALYLLGMTMTEEAKKEFEIAKRLSPDYPLPYHNLAMAYYMEGNYQKAITLDLKALEKKPDYQEAIYQIAKSYGELNQWENARIYLEKLIASAPASSYLPAYLDLLEAYLQRGDKEKASELAELMVQLPDTMPQVNYYRGMVFYRLEDLARAKFYFTSQAKTAFPSTNSLLMLGQIHYLEGDYKEAEAVFRKALEKQPWSMAANYNLAIILEMTDRFQEANVHFERAMAVDVFSLAPRIHLVKLYGHLGESSQRLDLVRRTFGLRPDSEEFAFLKSNEKQDLNRTLSGYEERFLSASYSPGSLKTRALIATLREDYPKAIRLYERHLQNLTDQKEIQRIKKEVLRLRGVLHGKEPLVTPA